MREVGAEPGEVGRPRQDDPLLPLLREGVVQRAQHDANQIAIGRLETLGEGLQAGRSVREGPSGGLAEHLGADPGHEGGAGLVVQAAVGVDDALFDPPGVGDEDDHEPITGHRHELDVSHRRPGERRVLDDGDLVGERREQASLRTVAAETPRACRSSSALEPTGSEVRT